MCVLLSAYAAVIISSFNKTISYHVFVESSMVQFIGTWLAIVDSFVLTPILDQGFIIYLRPTADPEFIHLNCDYTNSHSQVFIVWYLF